MRQFLLSEHTAFKEKYVLFFQSLIKLQKDKINEWYLEKFCISAFHNQNCGVINAFRRIILTKQNSSFPIHTNCKLTGNHSICKLIKFLINDSLPRGRGCWVQEGSEHAFPLSQSSNQLRHT